jgi:hypothetical protein
MKATVELSDQKMSEILELTSARKKGPAIPRLIQAVPRLIQAVPRLIQAVPRLIQAVPRLMTSGEWSWRPCGKNSGLPAAGGSTRHAVAAGNSSGSVVGGDQSGPGLPTD